MNRLYCPECGNYLEGGDGNCHDCPCGWKQSQQCECEHQDDERDTTLTSAPVCPHCGHEESDAWEINFGGVEGDTEHSCGNCGEDYFVSRQVTYRYTTKPIDQKGQP